MDDGEYDVIDGASSSSSNSVVDVPRDPLVGKGKTGRGRQGGRGGRGSGSSGNAPVGALCASRSDDDSDDDDMPLSRRAAKFTSAPPAPARALAPAPAPASKKVGSEEAEAAEAEAEQAGEAEETGDEDQAVEANNEKEVMVLDATEITDGGAGSSAATLPSSANAEETAEGGAAADREAERAQLEHEWRINGRIDGHEWIGKRVRRFFMRGAISDGVLSKWLPAGDCPDQTALWHAKHDDGDSEDLEAYEVEAALEAHLNQYTSKQSKKPRKAWAPRKPPSERVQINDAVTQSAHEVDPSCACAPYRPVELMNDVMQRAMPLPLPSAAAAADGMPNEPLVDIWGLSRDGPYVRNPDEISAERAIVLCAHSGGTIHTINMKDAAVGASPLKLRIRTRRAPASVADGDEAETLPPPPPATGEPSGLRIKVAVDPEWPCTAFGSYGDEQRQAAKKSAEVPTEAEGELSEPAAKGEAVKGEALAGPAAEAEAGAGDVHEHEFDTDEAGDGHDERDFIYISKGLPLTQGGAGQGVEPGPSATSGPKTDAGSPGSMGHTANVNTVLPGQAMGDAYESIRREIENAWHERAWVGYTNDENAKDHKSTEFGWSTMPGGSTIQLEARKQGKPYPLHAWTCGVGSAFYEASILPWLKDAWRALEEHFPETCKEMLDAVPPEYRLEGTAFTKVTVALNNPTPVHFDDSAPPSQRCCNRQLPHRTSGTFPLMCAHCLAHRQLWAHLLDLL